MITKKKKKNLVSRASKKGKIKSDNINRTTVDNSSGI